jgi:hypothetical protein
VNSLAPRRQGGRQGPGLRRRRRRRANPRWHGAIAITTSPRAYSATRACPPPLRPLLHCRRSCPRGPGHRHARIGWPSAGSPYTASCLSGLGRGARGGGMHKAAVPAVIRILLVIKIAKGVEKKEVCGQPAVEARARARDGSRSRWGALAEQGALQSRGHWHGIPKKITPRASTSPPLCQGLSPLLGVEKQGRALRAAGLNLASEGGGEERGKVE